MENSILKEVTEMALKIGFAAEHSDNRTVDTTNGLIGIPGTWFTLMVRKPSAVQYQVNGANFRMS